MPRGGKRSGAGRRVTKLGRTEQPLKKVLAEEILAESDEKEAWLALLSATITTSIAVIYPDGKESEEAPTRETITIPDNKIRLEARKYLTDRRDGKPAQAHDIKGQATLNVIIRDIGSKQS